MKPITRLALVAHDARKPTMIEWAKQHRETLARCELFATGTTGKLIEEATGLRVTKFLSGPMGGDLQLGGAIAEGKLDALVFLWDPLSAQPHDPDVRALIRVAVVWNIPVACNLATANMLIGCV
ncbi:MAG: methylglyoxal synthase [Fimbriiglobus sp.]